MTPPYIFGNMIYTMKNRPVAKGYCLECGPFLVWDAEKVKVIMNERPNPPEVFCVCPKCNLEINSIINFKHASIFKKLGVKIIHTYDDGDDVQPINEADIEFLKRNFDYILQMLMEG